MKFNFKKIASVFSSAVMVGSTVALAAAANFPAPFVQNGAGDVAIVYGSNAATTDLVAVADIQTALSEELAKQTATGATASSATVSGGDFFRIERGTATKFNLGNGILDVVSGTLTDDDLSTVLADGEYLDNDNSAKEYTQTIKLGNLTLSLFEDSDYKADTPTVGIRVPANTNVLNYTLEFSSYPDFDDLANTNIKIMGSDYFISSVSNNNNTISLLDAATTAIVNTGETKKITVGSDSYDVSIQAISSNGVIFVVNGETTNRLNTGQTFKLKNGAHIGVKDFQQASFAGDTSFAEFSIGTGRIELRDGLALRINDVNINDVTVDITNSSGQLQSIKLIWIPDEDSFITEDTSLTMPGFENVKLSFGGMTYPKEEKFSVEKGSNSYIQLKNVPLKTTTATIDLLYGSTGSEIFTGVGKESTKLLRTNNSGDYIEFDADTDQYFVVTYDDGTNAESYLVRATGFTLDNTGIVNLSTIEYLDNGVWTEKKKDARAGDTITLGSASLQVSFINRADKKINFTASLGSAGSFNTLYTKEGLKIVLPWLNETTKDPANNVSSCPTPATANGQLNINTVNITGTGVTTCYPTTYTLRFVEETKTESKGSGKSFNATLGWTSNKVTVSDVVGETPDGGLEIQDTDNFRSFVYGPLATELLHKTGGDQDSLDITYHGAESYGNAFVSEVSATVTPAASGSSGGSVKSLGSVIYKDTEAVSGKNLIVVGGSCINKVAASLLGSATPLCGADFTAKTGVASGQFLIQTYSQTGGKIATLVAGYNAADTTNAAKYLTTQAVDTTVGKKYVGTSATTATVSTVTA